MFENGNPFEIPSDAEIFQRAAQIPWSNNSTQPRKNSFNASAPNVVDFKSFEHQIQKKVKSYTDNNADYGEDIPSITFSALESFSSSETSRKGLKKITKLDKIESWEVLDNSVLDTRKDKGILVGLHH
jgi:hypothetical protein